MIVRMTLLSSLRIGCQVDRVWAWLRPIVKGYRLSFMDTVGWRCRASVLVAVVLTGGLWAPLQGQDSGLPPKGRLGQVWEAPLAASVDYSAAVEGLLHAYEDAVGQALEPGPRASVALKVNTRAGRGLSTPLPLLRAVIQSMEQRGFDRKSILIVDLSPHDLRQARILPPLSSEGNVFEGCPVLALENGDYYDEDWFYDSPLPPVMQQDPSLLSGIKVKRDLAEGAKERKSYLPTPLMFEVDFWLNLAVGVDDPALGVDGVLASATLWNVSNSQRFLVNQATASAAVAEIAAIPELSERMLLHFVSLSPYQFIGGPRFNSLYSRVEPKLLMSGDPVALDRILYDRINADRLLEGFPEITPLPKQLPFAASLGLGYFERSKIRIEGVDVASPVQRVTGEGSATTE